MGGFDFRDLPQEERLKYGIKDNLVRFSFGVEDFEDVKADILQALEAIWKWHITQKRCRFFVLYLSLFAVFSHRDNDVFELLFRDIYVPK